MKESQSITNSLLIEVDLLSNRLRNIKQSFKITHNKGLKERLFSENENIFKRVCEIYKIAELLMAPIGTQTVSVAPSFIETSPL